MNQSEGRPFVFRSLVYAKNTRRPKPIHMLPKTLPSGWRITTRSQIVKSAMMHSTPMIGIEYCSLLSDVSLGFLQNVLMLMLPGVLNGRKIAFSLFLREIRLRPTITWAISAPKLYNSATKLSSPERASATDTEENAIIEMNGVLRFLWSLPNALGITPSRLIA